MVCNYYMNDDFEERVARFNELFAEYIKLRGNC